MNSQIRNFLKNTHSRKVLFEKTMPIDCDLCLMKFYDFNNKESELLAMIDTFEDSLVPKIIPNIEIVDNSFGDFFLRYECCRIKIYNSIDKTGSESFIKWVENFQNENKINKNRGATITICDPNNNNSKIFSLNGCILRNVSQIEKDGFIISVDFFHLS